MTKAKREQQGKSRDAWEIVQERLAPSALPPIPKNVLGYAGRSAPTSDNILDIKKPNRLNSGVLENEKKEFVGYLTARFGCDPEVAAKAYEQLSPSFNRSRLNLPETAPELYESRNKDLGETPIDFIKRIWGSYIEAGILFQDDLRRLDPKLIAAVTSYCQRMGKRAGNDPGAFDARSFLPPPRQQRTDKLATQVDDEAYRAMRALEQRRYRLDKNIS